MTSPVPAVGTSGLYVLDTPYELRPATTYTCKAVRSFDDIYRLNEDVFALYYEPYGLLQADFDADVVAGAVIVTLMANEIGLETLPTDPNTIVYVPSTYILTFPDGNSIPYSHIVLSASLGALPDYLDVSDIMTDIGDIISDKIGVVPEVNIHKALTSGVMTSADHEIAETGRQAAIVNVTTTYTQFRDLTNLYNSLLGQYNDLEAAFIEMDSTSGENIDYLNTLGYFTLNVDSVALDDTIYVDSTFWNSVKLTMDLTGFAAGTYIDISTVSPVNGATAVLDVGDDIVITLNPATILTLTSVFNVKIYDILDVEIGDFDITLLYVDKTTNMIFGNTTLDFDLTLAGPHTQRIYFSAFTRLDRVLFDDVVVIDPFDQDEPYYELTEIVSGVTCVYGKNFIEFTVDEGLYTGLIDTTVPIVFIRRAGLAPSIVDTLRTYTIHITNAP